MIKQREKIEKKFRKFTLAICSSNLKKTKEKFLS